MPRSPGSALDELRVTDLSTLLNVYRTGSVTGAARELGVTASQVSKVIARAERALRTPLFTRGARGLAVTPAGERLLPRLEGIVQMVRALDRVEGSLEGELTLAAPSSLLPPILPRVANALPNMRIRGIELPPALLRRYATEAIFDVALLTGEVNRLPPRWSVARVGALRKSLFASPAVAKKLGTRPTEAQVRKASFVAPVAYDAGKVVSSPDDCPLGSERIIAVEVGTMDLALRVAAQCGHLAFGPVVAAHRELADGSLVELRVRGWDVSEPLLIACDAGRVLARVQGAIIAVLRATLGEGDEEVPASASGI